MPKPSLPPDQFELEVTAADIKKSYLGASRCPVAQAARRTFVGLNVFADYGSYPTLARLRIYTRLRIYSGCPGTFVGDWRLDTAAKELMSDFDEGRKVRPGKFKAVRVTS